jgi:hypothetical protein
VPDLDHANHVNASFTVVGSELRLSVTAVQPGSEDTVTVIYDAGWPAERPGGSHVLAVGHTSAPSWLTAADVWFEDVS